MSFWNYVFDNDYRQRADIESLRDRSRRQQRIASTAARRARRQSTELQEQVEELEEQVGSLLLMNRALLAMLRRQPDWSEEAFAKVLHDIDMEDGKLDGKVSG